jgi:hypothetical protein
MIAYLLAVYRVLSGRAWTRDTEHQLSSLPWNYENNEAEGGISDLSGNSSSRLSEALKTITVMRLLRRCLPVTGSPA